MTVAPPMEFSGSVRDLVRQLGDDPVTAWTITHVLLRDHPWYGGAFLLPLDGRKGTRRPLREWLSDLTATWSRLSPAGEYGAVLDGRRAILSLAALEPELGALIEATGLGPRLRSDVAAALAREHGEADAGQAAGTTATEAGQRQDQGSDGEPPTPVEDATDWQSDRPEADRDLLGRRPLAAELARRLQRIHGDGRQRGSFVVHLDGPWGSGKSTILNYLREELREPGWLIVEVNAWRDRRVRPAWYTLLTRLRQAMRLEMRGRHERARFWATEHAHRLHAAGPALWVAVGLTAGLLGAVLALGAGWITTTIGLLATLFAAGTLVGRTLFWDSAGSARFFERTSADPMERVARHVAWLLRRIAGGGDRPTLFLVDDLDRCDPEHVVELLEAVQNLVRDGAPDAAGPYVVVAADGAWVRHCYEEVYANFREPIGTPGQPLGYLFLDKLFQLSLEVPRVTPQRQEAYLRGLLGARADANGAASADGVARVRAAGDESTVLAAVADAPPEEQEDVIAAAVERLGERRVEAADRHALEAFAAHLPPNPRAMKRFVNAYGLARAVHVIELADVAMGPRAAWTILRMRWPALADALRERPELSAVALEGAEPSPDVPAGIALLLRAAEVEALLRAGGEPLDAAMIRRLTGAAATGAP